MTRRHTAYRDRDARPRPGAGVLLRHADTDGVVWWLLGERSPELRNGGWCCIGGSAERHESTLTAAHREFAEETGLPQARLWTMPLREVVVTGTVERPYTMLVLDCPDLFDDAVLSWEHTDLAWWRDDQVSQLDLHDGFADGWAQVTR